MNRELLEKRVADLQSAIEQSAAHHNALLGRFNEAKDLLSIFQNEDVKNDNDVIEVEISE